MLYKPNNNITYFSPFCLLGLIFNCGNNQEFKIQVFIYVNINGQAPAFTAIASHIFTTVASRDIFRKWV